MRHNKWLKKLLHWLGFGDNNNDLTINGINGLVMGNGSRSTRTTLWSCLAFFIVLIVWAANAQIDEVTRGEGKAIPSSRLQKIQNMEGGIVSEIFVHEGQIVEAGQPLLRLDDTRFQSNVGESEADRYALMAQILRLEAQIEDKPLVLSEDIEREAPGIASGERELFNTQRAQFNSEIAGLEEQLSQKKQEHLDFEAKKKQFSHSLGLIQQEVRMSEPLVSAGAISKVEILRLRRSEVETRGQLDSIVLAIPRALSAIKEIENKIAESRGRYRSEMLGQLNEARTNLTKIEASGKAIEDRVNRTLVTSPVRGVIQQMLVTTIGGVIQPGSELVEIVPLDDSLLVEAKIRPQDIAFLHPGQKAMIKFTAYDYTIYGGLKGSLEHISADTITDNEGRSFYQIRLRTDRNYLGSEDKPLLIIPGMVVSVDIITGQKTVLSYLLKPILRAKAEALRER
ncbi:MULTISPECIES: HlyD family type I secretion periplasmic adaptor subunit [unclassified Klebsiella]|uniref:HlyD family type I secretion periplasmic adaptor subunit n=1 Tax=Enterobacteriaceae TaxID=543 RepID=UPI0015DCEB41|nr:MULTISPECIES: HlyD family type I secretion periplasmic adaptor subunit [unclassified Klebsiella]HAT3955152.1 HlyD family type I secretion periplasmic adaptor subunit [Kluyvera ascorbata]BBQ82242.1 HlyD family type I secretion periplasmic adaptor subunit [Klebsiella sp. WP3-W18-ESBL-02]BBR19287.1 HlyD family type I secretion periplasmic adaptor subunit [Klebsiella sp. WP3-S18-ESBL-05]BBR57463.1 HlyD family type I secretion periplasmic adaptor subunit [Klebsiella sp. WP4-W18-ESBL-05]BBS90200.